MGDDRDPVWQILGSSQDLYDVADWERRTLLDSVAVYLYAILRVGARVTLLLAATVILLSQIALSGFAIVENPTLGFLTSVSVLPALVLAGYVWREDPTLKQPLDGLVVTFSFGVLFAGFAAVVNSATEPLFGAIPVVGTAIFFFLVVGPVEESVKWLAVRLHGYRRDDFHAVIDGAVYGAVAGLGFATIENAIYITQVYLDASQAGVSAVELGRQTIGVASVRSLAGPGHVIYAAFSGYYLGLAKFNPENRGPIIVKGLLIAALVHGTYNTAVTYLPELLPTFPFWAFLGFVVVFDGVFVYLLYRKLSRYSSVYVQAKAAIPSDVPERAAPGEVYVDEPETVETDDDRTE